MSAASDYISEITTLYADKASGEYTYRTAFEQYLKTVFTVDAGYTVRHERSTGSALVKYLLKVHAASPYEKVIVVFDQALPKKARNNFLKSVKPELKKIGTPFAIYFHRTMSDFNGQIADYCAWAKYVSLERAEMRPLAELNQIPKNEFDIFERGVTFYY